MSRRRGPSARVCIVADLRDLAAARRLLHDLPPDVFGQMYVSSDAGIWPVDVPARVQVSWLSGRPGSLAAALGAWAGEWITEEALCGEQLPLVWVFPHAAAQLTEAASETIVRLLTAMPGSHLMQGHDGVLPGVLDSSVSL